MACEVIVVGSYNQDHVWRIDRFPTPGETRRGHAFQTGPGGKGFNQAVACHRQGVATLFIGALGDDALGQTARTTAESFGLPCRWQTCKDAPTAATCVIVDDAGRNEIVVHLAANEHLDPAFLAAQPEWRTAGVFLTQMENNLAATRAALGLAGQHGLVRILNPAPVHAGTTQQLIDACDILTPNETEFAMLLGKLAGVTIEPDAVAATADAEMHALCRRLTKGTVIITLGAHGSFVSHGADRRGDGEACYRVGAEPVHAIDTTGAGDAFSGALAAALVRFAAQPFSALVRHAGRVAALATEQVGAASASPDFAAVISRFGAPEKSA